MTVLNFDKAKVSRDTTKLLIDGGLSGTPAMYDMEFVHLMRFAVEVTTVLSRYISNFSSREQAICRLTEIKVEIVELSKGERFVEEFALILEKVDEAIAELFTKSIEIGKESFK
ncbi:hypothetical protein [Sporosarcina sp. ITBMC105]